MGTVFASSCKAHTLAEQNIARTLDPGPWTSPRAPAAARAFARLCKEVFTARMEANDNIKYLRTLEHWFQQALSGEDDFSETLEQLFKLMLLLWKSSKHSRRDWRWS